MPKHHGYFVVPIKIGFLKSEIVSAFQNMAAVRHSFTLFPSLLRAVGPATFLAFARKQNNKLVLLVEVVDLV